MPEIISLIFKEAFDFRSAGVGVGSYGFVRAMRFGVARGILSNEAGSGTSPTAHAGSDTNSPCEQGFFGIVEVFIDTILLCSLTAFVILLSGKYTGDDAMLVSIDAFGAFIGRAAPYFIGISVGFFAFATIICWSVYGAEALRLIKTRSGIHRLQAPLFPLRADRSTHSRASDVGAFRPFGFGNDRYKLRISLILIKRNKARHRQIFSREHKRRYRLI